MNDEDAKKLATLEKLLNKSQERLYTAETGAAHCREALEQAVRDLFNAGLLAEEAEE